MPVQRQLEAGDQLVGHPSQRAASGHREPRRRAAMAAFQTPQTGGKEPFTSLLFTPKTGDGGAKTVPDYRTPRHRSPPATAFGGTSRFAAGRDSTPQTRRRSLTPASSMARDTPPAPPMDSLLDSTEGGQGGGRGGRGASLACWCLATAARRSCSSRPQVPAVVAQAGAA